MGSRQTPPRWPRNNAPETALPNRRFSLLSLPGCLRSFPLLSNTPYSPAPDTYLELIRVDYVLDAMSHNIRKLSEVTEPLLVENKVWRALLPHWPKSWPLRALSRLTFSFHFV